MSVINSFVKRAVTIVAFAGVALAYTGAAGIDGALAVSQCVPYIPSVVTPDAVLPSVLTKPPADTIRTLKVGESASSRWVNGKRKSGYDIVAWERGMKWDEAKKVAVVLGQIHGNEYAQYETLSAIKTMRVPAGWSLLIIPTGNPDGAASAAIGISGRRNVNGVDLNRNWSVGFSPSGCGSKWGGNAPFSEPETKALARFIEGVRPQFQVTFHSDFNILISANTPVATKSGDAWQAGYIAAGGPNAPRHTHSSPFTGGQMTDWVAARMGSSRFKTDTASLLVEIRPCHMPLENVVANTTRSCGNGTAWYKATQARAHVAGLIAALRVAPPRPAELLPKPKPPTSTTIPGAPTTAPPSTTVPPPAPTTTGPVSPSTTVPKPAPTTTVVLTSKPPTLAPRPTFPPKPLP